MSNYITAEEFLKQSDKVQTELRNWWKPYKYDLCYDVEYRCEEIIGNVKDNRIRLINNAYIAKDGDINNVNYIPLLQMHQLIQFIEDKAQSKLMDVKYCINPKESSIPQYKIEDINTGEQNLLQALWKATIEIIEDGE